MPYKNTTLDRKLNITVTSTLAKVKDAQQAGEFITGAFSETGWEPPDPVVLCVAFANARTDADVVNFTKKYGPVCGLDSKLQGNTRAGQSFRFSIGEWRQRQYEFKKTWELLASAGPHTNPGAENWYGGMAHGDFWSFKNGDVKFLFSDLRRLLNFWLMAIPPERRRLCARPECGTFFFAEHLNQSYCSDGCAEWGQRKVKLDHWNKNKKKYLASRSS